MTNPSAFAICNTLRTMSRTGATFGVFERGGQICVREGRPTDVQTAMPSVLTPAEKMTTRWICVCMLSVLLLAAGCEIHRIGSAMDDGMSLLAAVSFWDFESTIPLLLLSLLPLFFVAFRKAPGQWKQSRPAAHAQGWFVASLLTVFTTSLAASAAIGWQEVEVPVDGRVATSAFCDLPPAYHDEYSYLLQAETFSRFRLSFPPRDEFADLFHQIHVRNQPRTVSRYFPTTGLYVALFLGSDHPIYGHWLAGALAAVFFAAAVAQVLPMRTAFCCGMLIGVSPGIAVFSNLLLAHHPTLLCLSVFTWAFVHLKKSERTLLWSVVAGVALTLAMLARPMTAAGFALPFGVDLLMTISQNKSMRQTVAGFGLPLAAGFLFLAVMNHDATGDWTTSAYQSYTDDFTPKHKYGFDNALETPRSQGPPALQKYDDWATNLTPQRAVKNVVSRLLASSQWSLGRLPVLLGLLLTFPLLFGQAISPRQTSEPTSMGRPGATARWLTTMLFASFMTLHLAHVPYWFDGILHWHYVFETAPILIILATIGFAHSAPYFRRTMGLAGVVWICAFMLGCLIPGWFRLPMFQGTSKISAAVSEQAFSRKRMQAFQNIIHSEAVTRPALILVDEANSDPQLSYIINPPDYESDVLVCRLPESDERLGQLKESFRNRTLYVFAPKALTLSRLAEQ